MFGSKKSISNWTEQGERTKATIRSFFDMIDPNVNKESATEIAEIANAITNCGEWVKEDEWRISTWMKTVIKSEMLEGKQWFFVFVDCDGQILSCRCPTVERAFAFYKLYAHIIVYQFYGMGPPWAG